MLFTFCLHFGYYLDASSEIKYFRLVLPCLTLFVTASYKGCGLY